MQNNRRKYDGLSLSDQLEIHEKHDDEKFEDLRGKLSRVEKAIYGLYVAIAVFGFLIEHPHVIENLAEPAKAAEIK